MSCDEIGIENFVFAGLKETYFLIKKSAVKFITDNIHLAVLFSTKKASRAADFQVAITEAAAENAASAGQDSGRESAETEKRRKESGRSSSPAAPSARE